MDASDRTVAISPYRSTGGCLRGSSVPMDSVQTEGDSSIADLLSPQPMPKTVMSIASTYGFFHSVEPTPRNNHPLPIQSPRIVANRNSKEWIS